MKTKRNDFSKISGKTVKKISLIISLFLLAVFIYVCFEIYMPLNPTSHETITYTAQKGMGDDEIAKELEKVGVIRSSWFFRFYVVASFQHSSLQAGRYNLSSRMSIYQIVKKMAQGNVIKDTLVILEGWDIRDIGKYLETKNICSQADFIKAANKDYSSEFEFLKDKPKDISLEGYLFPDTYQTSGVESCDDIVLSMLSNFDKKLTPVLRAETIKQGKTITEIITMASIIEKEVGKTADKKIVSGIFWKRISIGMALQSCATINYITGKSDPGALLKDIKIDSPYNTYMYKGLPVGPICSPGIGSIEAALSPTKTNYLFFLSNGKTIYSRTAEEHAANKAKYLN